MLKPVKLHTSNKPYHTKMLRKKIAAAYWNTLCWRRYKMGRSSDAIRSVAHPDGGNAQPLYSIRVPPIRCRKQEDLFILAEFLEKFWYGGGSKIWQRHCSVQYSRLVSRLYLRAAYKLSRYIRCLSYEETLDHWWRKIGRLEGQLSA